MEIWYRLRTTNTDFFLFDLRPQQMRPQNAFKEYKVTSRMTSIFHLNPNWNLFQFKMQFQPLVDLYWKEIGYPHKERQIQRFGQTICRLSGNIVPNAIAFIHSATAAQQNFTYGWTQNFFKLGGGWGQSKKSDTFSVYCTKKNIVKKVSHVVGNGKLHLNIFRYF